MLPVFTAEEVRRLDRRAVEEMGISSLTLMENAGAGAAAEIVRRFAPRERRQVVIAAGKGNNGGDGFVVARFLRELESSVSVFLLGRGKEVAGDAAAELARFLELGGEIVEVTGPDHLDQLEAACRASDLIVDALLGTGLTGPARDLVAEAIEAINRSGKPVVSLDLPSGLSSDRGELLGPAICATLTTTFAGWKRGLLLHPGAGKAGEVSVVGIGIPPGEAGLGITTFLLEAADVKPLFPSRPPDAHKGSYGHLLIVAGSQGKTGAAALAAMAALRSGVGLATVVAPASQQPIIAALGMEFMTEPLPETAAQSLSLKVKDRIVELARKADAVAVGPGLSLDPETQALVRELVRDLECPLVVDADGLSALVDHLEIVGQARFPRCLTPHPGEMARMLQASVAQVQSDRIETARAFSSRFGAFLALKGAGSVIGEPGGRVFINPTGNPGMATGGSGDVLTGMAGAFLARGFMPLQALQAAVYLHGLAGDLARDEKGEEGLIAGDILEAIPAAILKLQRDG